MRQSVGVEAAQLVGFLPSEDAVGLPLVFLGWQLVLLDIGDIRVVGALARGPGVGYL